MGSENLIVFFGGGSKAPLFLVPLLCIKGIIQPDCIGILISHYKDHVMNQSICTLEV